MPKLEPLKLELITGADTKAFDQVEKKIGGFSKKMESLKPVFTKMTAIGTAAFVGLGAGVFKMTQEASDAQEIFSKFDVVFQDVSDDAERMAQNLRDNFGMAESSAKDLLSGTGDMLTGFGFTGAAALDLAGQVSELGTDLASFTNLQGGSERAVRILTKGLLGERESMKELGIAIMEEDVKAHIEANKTKDKYIGKTEREQKAIATLELAMKQSKNAIGDYGRTADGAANQQRLLNERFKEMRENIGTAFIPALEKVLETVTPLIEKFAKWAKENPELVTKIVIVAGAISGLAVAIGAIGLIVPPILAGLALLGSTVFLIGAAIALVAFTIYKAWTENWGGIQEKVKAVGDWLTNTFLPAIHNVFEWIKEKLDWLVNNWQEAVGFVIGFFATLPIKLPILAFQALSKVIEIVRGIDWAHVFSVILEAGKKIFGKIFDAGKELFEKLKAIDWGQLFKDIGKGIGNSVLGLIEGAIKGALAGIPGIGDFSLPRFAGGVRNFEGGLAIVGERGPELVNLPRNSDVIPNSRIQQVQGSGVEKSITVNQYIQDSVDLNFAFRELAYVLKTT